jgi:cytochrome c556
MIRWAALIALAGIVACAAPRPTTPEIAARQELMRSNRGALIELGKMASGEAAWDQRAAERHAATLMRNAVMIPAKTEEGTGPESGRTRARPEIWQTWEKFQAAADNLEDQSKAILDLARANNEAAVRSRFAALEQACDGCHKPFMFPEFPR